MNKQTKLERKKNKGRMEENKQTNKQTKIERKKTTEGKTQVNRNKINKQTKLGRKKRNK